MHLRRITEHVQRPVIAGPDPAIHFDYELLSQYLIRNMDHPIKSGDDERGGL